MTSIKPPGGLSQPPITATEGLGPAAGAGSAEGSAGAEASAAVGSLQGNPAVGSVQGGAAGGSDPIAQLSRAVASGDISPEQAVEQLIDRAVAGASAHLSAAERAELTSVLRAALEGDPVLRSVLEPG